MLAGFVRAASAEPQGHDPLRAGEGATQIHDFRGPVAAVEARLLERAGIGGHPAQHGVGHAGKALAAGLAHGGNGPVHRGVGRHLGAVENLVGGQAQDAAHGQGHGGRIFQELGQNVVQAAAQAQIAVDQLRGQAPVPGVQGGVGQGHIQGGLDVLSRGFGAGQHPTQHGQGDAPGRRQGARVGRLAGLTLVGSLARLGCGRRPMGTRRTRPPGRARRGHRAPPAGTKRDKPGKASKRGGLSAAPARKKRKAVSRWGRATRVSRQGPFGRSLSTP